MTLTTPRKTTPWQVIGTGRVSERVPRVSGYQYYALPFLADAAVNWAAALAGIDPRATLISIYPKGHAKADQVYPTDITEQEDRDNFLGVLVDGFNYEQDLNITVQLQGALETRYIQNSVALPWGQDDPVVLANLEDAGITRIKKLMFWDTTRKALK